MPRNPDLLGRVVLQFVSVIAYGLQIDASGGTLNLFSRHKDSEIWTNGEDK
jgi:hypothetical protein